MEHFRAEFKLFDGEAAPPTGYIEFGDNGLIQVSTRHDESRDRATIAIRSTPRKRVQAGESFVADFSVAFPEYWQDKARVGYSFHVGTTKDHMKVTILEILPDDSYKNH